MMNAEDETGQAPIDSEMARRSLELGEFLPYFQPKVTLHTGQLAGFEILARWQHPMLGLIAPDRFIHLAEDDGWIDDLTEALLKKAFAAARWIPEGLTLAVNISAVQLTDLGLPGRIRASAEAGGFALERLKIEVTESSLMDRVGNMLTVAAELNAMGCRLSMDDFGTGYSSLLSLQAMPFYELKVDRSFVSSMVERRQSRKIVSAVVGLGQSLGLCTVAEGIETQEQAEMLLCLGCDVGQGWFYGRPMAAEGLREAVAAPCQKLKVRESSPWRSDALGRLDGSAAQRFAHLQALYDGAPVGLAFVDHNLRYVSVNRRLAEMNGVPPEEHLGAEIAATIPDLFPHVEPLLVRALRGESIKDVEVTIPSSGETRLLSYQPALDEVGEVIGVSVAVVDVTERKRAQDALRESEEHYRSMVDLNPQVLWIMDAQGRNLDVSPRWDRATGQMQEGSKDYAWMDALHPDDLQRTVYAIAQFRRSGSPISVEYRVRNGEDGWRWMRSRGTPRFDAGGNITCWYGSVEDIDELKRTEWELMETKERLRECSAALQPESVDGGFVGGEIPVGTGKVTRADLLVV
jgi:PAS domain S-box-containing protein